MTATDDDHKDLDQLADFVLSTIKSGKVDIMGALGIGAPLKRQAGNIGPAMGHLLRRYCRDDPKVSALVDLAVTQSPAFAQLAERLGLIIKPVEPLARDSA